MIRIIKKILATTLVCYAAATSAAVIPLESETDPRVKVLIYEPDQVYTITGHYFFSTTITLERGERVIHKSLGDPKAWDLVDKQHFIFLKPIDNLANTNMTIITNRRTYYFELSASITKRDSPEANFAIKFAYPVEEQRQLVDSTNEIIEEYEETYALPESDGFSPADLNMDYGYKGNTDLKPNHVFDDGKWTYFEFNDNVRTPAIFSVSGGKEHLINAHKNPSSKYVIVKNISKQFVLRMGDQTICVFNKSVGG
jgi:type IV secretion system protein VirB9